MDRQTTKPKTSEEGNLNTDSCSYGEFISSCDHLLVYIFVMHDVAPLNKPVLIYLVLTDDYSIPERVWCVQ